MTAPEFALNQGALMKSSAVTAACLAMAVTMSPAWAADSQGNMGAWVFKTESSEGDVVTASITLTSINTMPDTKRQQRPVSAVLWCTSTGRLSFTTLWPRRMTRMGESTGVVRWKIDQGSRVVDKWSASPSGDVLGLDVAVTTRPFADKLRKSSTLLIEVGRDELRFDTTGADEAISRLYQACGITAR